MPSQIAPATLEGWYALHQVFSLDWPAFRGKMAAERLDVAESACRLFGDIQEGENGGWSAAFRLVGGGGDWMFVHFRPTLEELAAVQLRLRDSGLGELLRLEYDYLSVTEAGLYHATSQAAAEAAPGSVEYRALIEQAQAAEAASAHVKSRLYPEVPEGMRYVSFYPVNKKRGEQHN